MKYIRHHMNILTEIHWTYYRMINANKLRRIAWLDWLSLQNVTQNRNRASGKVTPEQSDELRMNGMNIGG